MTTRTKGVLAWTGGVAAALFAGLALWVAAPLPRGLIAAQPIPVITLEDREGRVLRTTRSTEGARGGWVSLAELDPKLAQAFVTMEDRRFYDHHGVDLRALFRALRDNVSAGHVVSGGSTLTMQLARLLRGTPRTLPGKLRQMLWALRLDRHLEKRDILEQYLNRVPLGQGTVGVAAAAALYFDRSAKDLSLGQAALLGALARAPSRDNPIAAPGSARRRRDLALARLVAQGYASDADARRAALEPVLARDRASPFLAPHFTSRVLQWTVPSGGDSTWRTSLDLGLQTELEAEVRHTVDVLRDRIVAHAAVVVLDNASGDVLAWVGSPDFWADTAGQVDMVVSPRQPGSALKPFVYGLAFDRGYTAASILPDLPRTFQTTVGPYRPRNYDRRFHGPVRAREALASSYNVPAVELAEALGMNSVLRTLRLAGFATLSHGAEFYGLGLALGNGDVTLLELANGYRALANGGRWRPWQWRLDDREPAPDTAASRRVMSPRAAAIVLDILSDRAARAPSFGLDTPLDFPFRAAAKTGTSRHYTDNWAAATTGRFTVAVWVGNFSGRPMQGVGGITGAGPLLHRAVLLTARRYPPGDLLTPQETGAVPLRICRLSGLRATPDCPGMIEWFAPDQAPARDCDWHRGGGREVIPAQYVLEEGDEAATNGGAFHITAPRDGDRYARPVGVAAAYATIALTAAGGTAERAGANTVRWFVDGREMRGPRWQLTPGPHVIRARTAAGETDAVRIAVDP